MWLGCGSDVFSDVVEKVWQKLRERGFQHFREIALGQGGGQEDVCVSFCPVFLCGRGTTQNQNPKESRDHLSTEEFACFGFPCCAGLVQSPKTPRIPKMPDKTRKNKIPHPGLAPENMKKKHRKNTKTVFSLGLFFRHFFVFRGPRQGGDFVFHLVCAGFWVFGFCSRPAGSQFQVFFASHKRPISTAENSAVIASHDGFSL